MSKAEKYIGLLGLGSRSTAFYVEELNRQFRQFFKEYNTCPFKLLNTNFNNINPHLPDDFVKLIPVTRHYLQELQKLKIHNMLIPNITLHETVDKINTTFEVPLIHAVHSSVRQLSKDGVNEVLLLGTTYTVQASYLKDIFQEHHINITTLPDSEQIWIDKFRKTVYAFEESVGLLSAFTALLNAYLKKEKVILIACTELSAVLQTQHSNIYDMARIQIKAAIEQNRESNEDI